MSSGDSRKPWLELGIMCDVADAAVGLLAGRKGEVSKLSNPLVTAPALLGIALGVAGLQGAEDGSSPPIS